MTPFFIKPFAVILGSVIATIGVWLSFGDRFAVQERFVRVPPIIEGMANLERLSPSDYAKLEYLYHAYAKGGSGSQVAQVGLPPHKIASEDVLNRLEQLGYIRRIPRPGRDFRAVWITATGIAQYEAYKNFQANSQPAEPSPAATSTQP